MNWQPIATRFFPTKSANACRKRHERLMERRYQEEWEQDRLEELATAYFDCRKEMWAILGERLGERWGLVEGKVGTTSMPGRLSLLTCITVHGKGTEEPPNDRQGISEEAYTSERRG